jgi:hypothetical protein
LSLNHASKRYLAMAATLGLGLSLGHALTASEQGQLPVQATLVKAIEAGRVKVGDTVLAKSKTDWLGPRCMLRRGATLKGRIVAAAARSKAAKTSSLNLVFESAECDGKALQPLFLTVAAVVAPDPDQESDGSHYQPLSQAVGAGIGGSNSGAGGNLRSVTGAAATVYDEPRSVKQPKSVLPGQVVGIPRLKLSVGNGPENSSTLSASGQNVRLEPGTQLILVPTVRAGEAAAPARLNESTAAPATRSRSQAAVSQTVPAAVEEGDETEVCTPPHCTVALSPSENEPGVIRATATLSTKNLGYFLRPDHEMYRFDYDAALAYAGPQKVLFTFNPHVLVARAGESAPQMRTIRGVLIDLASKKVEKTVDWRVLDAGRYLWPAGNDGILVHVGRELRLYGSGLKLEQQLSLDGALSFVRVSPSGTYFAVGVVRERHSPAIHQQLAEAENREPEEDVEVHVLNAKFVSLATVLRSSRDVPPVLSDRGEIQIPAIGKNRWRIVEFSWDGQRRVLGQVSSTCRPEASSLPPDLLFVVGCDRQADGRWYRMLRADGKPVLKGWSPSADLGHTAVGIGNAFSIGIAHATISINPDAPFRSRDIANQHIAVYDAENGQRIFAITIAGPVPTQQTFALAPQGNRLAVLEQNDIAIYEVPAGTAKALP